MERVKRAELGRFTSIPVLRTVGVGRVTSIQLAAARCRRVGVDGKSLYYAILQVEQSNSMGIKFNPYVTTRVVAVLPRRSPPRPPC